MSLFGRARIIWRNNGKPLRQYCTGKQGPASKPAATAKPQSSTTVKADVPGLSSNCLHVTNAEVGPGASKTGNYKNPEYFLYHPFSYFEAEIEMAKYRCPQPSPFKK